MESICAVSESQLLTTEIPWLSASPARAVTLLCSDDCPCGGARGIRAPLYYTHSHSEGVLSVAFTFHLASSAQVKEIKIKDLRVESNY